MSTWTDSEWLAFSAKDVAGGGSRCSRDEALSLAKTRRKVGGLFPCEYPAKDGGCYVAECVGQKLTLRHIEQQRERVKGKV